MHPNPIGQFELFSKLYKSPKFAFEVFDVELAVVEPDFRVSAGNGDISDSDFALVASSKTDGDFFLWTYDMKVSFLEFFSAFVLLGDTLKDDVRLCGLFESNHFYVFACLEFDCFGEEGLADLAFKL